MQRLTDHTGWRDRLRKVRQLGREAEHVGGMYRRNLLIQASRILVQLVVNTEPRDRQERVQFQQALLEAENWIHELAQECIGCLSEEEIPQG